MAAAVQQGAQLKVVGAFMQTNPFCIVSLPDNPIKTPQDMVGKKIAVQALNDSLWSALLKINKIGEGDVTKVVAQFDPAPLINKEVDGFLSFVTNQNITIEIQTGITPTIMMLSDFGFTLYQQLYTVSADTLANKRDVVVAGLRSEIIGRQLCAADQAAGVALSLDKYSVDLKQDPKYAARALAETVKLGDTPTTRAKGLMYMSADDIAKNVQTLGLLGLSVPAETYTADVLDEIFAAGPVLSV
jgi:ABC-type nitrate/sulfonate/bicarbonate transport system substrate-binding protein